MSHEPLNALTNENVSDTRILQQWNNVSDYITAVMLLIRKNVSFPSYWSSIMNYKPVLRAYICVSERDRNITHQNFFLAA